MNKTHIKISKIFNEYTHYDHTKEELEKMTKDMYNIILAFDVRKNDIEIVMNDLASVYYSVMVERLKELSKV